MCNSFFPKNNQFYYIPIVANLDLADTSEIRFWQYAMQPEVARHFLISPGSLQGSTDFLSKPSKWYKVNLTEAQKSQLTFHQDSHFVGFIAFQPKQIISIIHIENGDQKEFENPHYQGGNRYDDRKQFSETVSSV